MDITAFIASTRRIQVFSNNEWRKYADKIAIDLGAAPPALIIEDFVVAIGAALSGQGLALIPEILVREYIKSGKLVAFCPDRITWDQTYYITHAPNAERNPIIRDVINWLHEQVAHV